MVRRLFFVGGLIMSVGACGSGEDTPSPTPTPESAGSLTPPPTPLPTLAPTPDADDLQIEVVDQNGVPWKGVTLWVGSAVDAESAITDDEGRALLHDVAVPYNLNAHALFTVRLSYSNVAKYNRIYTYPDLSFVPVRLTLFRPPDYTSQSYHEEVGGELTGIDPEDQESQVYVMGGGTGVGMRPDADTLPWALEPPSRPTYFYAVQTPVSADGYYDNNLIPTRFGLVLDPTEGTQTLALNRSFSSSLSVSPVGLDPDTTDIQMFLDWTLPQDRGSIDLYDDAIPIGAESYSLRLPPDDPDLGGDTLALYVDAVGPDSLQETYVPEVLRGQVGLPVQMLAVPRVDGYFPLTTTSIQGTQLAVSSLDEAERTGFVFAEIWYQPTSIYGGYTLLYHVVSSSVEGAGSVIQLPIPPSSVVWPSDTTDDYILARYAYVSVSADTRLSLRYLPTSP